MTIHTKAIARATKIIDDAIERVETEKREAEANFWDTGYQRYDNKKAACEDALEELTKFRYGYEQSKRYRRKISQMEKGIEIYMTKLDELRNELRGDVPDNVLNYIIGRCKARLDIALDEAEREY